jgi:hypothetical protein
MAIKTNIRVGVDKSYWDCIVDGICPFARGEKNINGETYRLECPKECPLVTRRCSEYDRIREVGYRREDWK